MSLKEGINPFKWTLGKFAIAKKGYHKIQGYRQLFWKLWIKSREN